MENSPDSRPPSIEVIAAQCWVAFGSGSQLTIDDEAARMLDHRYRRLLDDNACSWQQNRLAVLIYARALGRISAQEAGSDGAVVIGTRHVAEALRRMQERWGDPGILIPCPFCLTLSRD